MEPVAAPPRHSSGSIARVLRNAVLSQAVIVIAVITATSVGFVAYRSLTEHERTTFDVLVDLVQAQTDVLGAQSSHRGWALTQEPEFLHDYEEAETRARALLDSIESRLEGDNRLVVHQAREIEAAWRVDFAESVERFMSDGRTGEAAALIQSGEGQARIDAVISRLRRVESRVERDLGNQRARTDAVVKSVVFALLAFGTALGIGVLVVARGIRRRVTDPTSRLADVARRLGEGDLAVRADVVGVDETQVVAQAFNKMATEMEGTVTALRELDDLKTQFVSSVSHELRTPLTSIRGYLEALLEHEAGELNDEQKEYAEIAYRNAGRLETLIDDLLVLSKLESGRFALRTSRFDVARMVRSLVDDFAPAADAASVSLAADATDELWVEGDADRLRQVAANLISNAIKFTPAQGHIRVAAASDSDGSIRIVVSDTGVGIPDDELPQIAERFFRASSAEGIEGTGLGLAISREFVELHGGRLEIESRAGDGTTCTVHLPGAPSI